MIDRGEIWLARLDPVLPGEQGGTRPALVVSTPAFNSWRVGLVVVVPLTTRQRGFRHHVQILDEGLDELSFAMPEYVRSITQQRLLRRIATAPPDALAAIDQWLRRITGNGTGSACP